MIRVSACAPSSTRFHPRDEPPGKAEVDQDGRGGIVPGATSVTAAHRRRSQHSSRVPLEAYSSVSVQAVFIMKQICGEGPSALEVCQ